MNEGFNGFSRESVLGRTDKHAKAVYKKYHKGMTGVHESAAISKLSSIGLALIERGFKEKYIFAEMDVIARFAGLASLIGYDSGNFLTQADRMYHSAKPTRLCPSYNEVREILIKSIREFVNAKKPTKPRLGAVDELFELIEHNKSSHNYGTNGRNQREVDRKMGFEPQIDLSSLPANELAALEER